MPNDRHARGPRFGCGALAGFAVGFVSALQSGNYAWAGVLTVGLGVSVLFGLAALLFGKKFLDKLFDWLSWMSF